MTIAEGFPGQRLLVVPRPTIRAALARPGTSHLVVTDCGFFPEARSHGITRTVGIDQAIVIACTKGRGWAVIDGVEHSVHPGQVLVVPPGQPHSYGADLDDPWTAWWLHIAGRDLHELLSTVGMTAAQPVRTASDFYRVVGLVEEVVQRVGADATWDNLVAASGAAWHLLAVLSADRQVSGTRGSAVDSAREYLRTHLAERVSISDLAQMASVSPSHFAALFRDQVGVPVLQYQTQLRMARARELLDTTTLDIAAIALDTGYPDAYYFSRLFRKVHGVPPRQYRAQVKG